MLPFLAKKNSKQVTGIITEVRKPDAPEEQKEEGSDGALRACARDLIDGVQANDEAKVVAAIQAAFQILDTAE